MKPIWISLVRITSRPPSLISFLSFLDVEVTIILFLIVVMNIKLQISFS